MGIFDGIMILSDLDGTLLDHGELSRQHLEAVHYFVENGGAFCPATGRAENFLFENFPDLPLKSYCIVKNGAAIYDCGAKKYIWKRLLDGNAVERVFCLLERFPAIERVAFHLADQYIVLDRNDSQLKNKMRSVRDQLLKIVLRAPASCVCDLARYCEQSEDYRYVRSADFLFEILDKETGKGVCTEVLRTLLPDRKCFVGIGDYENDITLLEASDIAVAVDGGFAPLKDYADWVAPPIEEYPIAWLVERLEREIRAKTLI